MEPQIGFCTNPDRALYFNYSLQPAGRSQYKNLLNRQLAIL